MPKMLCYMKATIKNLKKALRESAEAHNVEYKNWSDEGQIGIHSESIPVVADVKMILESFYGERCSDLYETGYGYTTVYLYDFMDDESREVDLTLLTMALPYDCKLWE